MKIGLEWIVFSVSEDVEDISNCNTKEMVCSGKVVIALRISL